MVTFDFDYEVDRMDNVEVHRDYTDTPPRKPNRCYVREGAERTFSASGFKILDAAARWAKDSQHHMIPILQAVSEFDPEHVPLKLINSFQQNTQKKYLPNWGKYHYYQEGYDRFYARKKVKNERDEALQREAGDSDTHDQEQTVTHRPKRPLRPIPCPFRNHAKALLPEAVFSRLEKIVRYAGEETPTEVDSQALADHTPIMHLLKTLCHYTNPRNFNIWSTHLEDVKRWNTWQQDRDADVTVEDFVPPKSVTLYESEIEYVSEEQEEKKESETMGEPETKSIKLTFTAQQFERIVSMPKPPTESWAEYLENTIMNVVNQAEVPEDGLSEWE